MDFINRVYTAPERKQKQRQRRRQVNCCHCKRLRREDAALRWAGQCELLHELNMLFCDMQEDPTAYYFAFWPTFELNPEVGEVLDDRLPYLAKCTEPSVTDTGSLSLRTFDDTEILVDLELSDEEGRHLRGWHEEAGLRRHDPFTLHGPAALRGHLLQLDHGVIPIGEDLRWIR